MNEASPHSPVSADQAIYYHNDVFGSQILVRILEPWLGHRVLEVGAGVGHITTELARHCREVVALEPTPDLYHQLHGRTDALPNVTCHRQTLDEFGTSSAQQTTGTVDPKFDTVVYINVLEHINDHIGELSRARAFLNPGGRVLIVVPAHQWLYSKVDRLTGHFRRYSKQSLGVAIQTSGLRTAAMRFFDSVGLIPYLVIYRWLQSTATEGTNATVYSRVILPLSYVLYKLSRGRLIGKNLVAIATA